MIRNSSRSNESEKREDQTFRPLKDQNRISPAPQVRYYTQVTSSNVSPNASRQHLHMPPITELTHYDLPYQDSKLETRRLPRATSDFYHRNLKLVEIQGEVGKNLSGTNRLN